MSICWVFVFCCTAAAVSGNVPLSWIFFLHSPSFLLAHGSWGSQVGPKLATGAALLSTFFFAPPRTGVIVALAPCWGLIDARFDWSEVLWLQLWGPVDFLPVSRLVPPWVNVLTALTVSVTKCNRWLLKVGLIFTTTVIRHLSSYSWIPVENAFPFMENCDFAPG